MQCFVHQDSSCSTGWEPGPGVWGAELGIRAQKKQRSGTSLAFITFFPLFKNKTRLCSENKKLETCDTLPVWYKTIPVLISSLSS